VLIPLLLTFVALGAPPGSLLPLVERDTLPVAFAEAARGHGAEDGATVAACRPFAEELVVCLTVPEGKVRRLVTVADLEIWGVPQSEALRLAVARMAAGLGPTRPEVVSIPDDSRTYLLSAEGDGLDQAALFSPEVLAARFPGQAFVVGIPARGVLIAIPLGDPELEQMVAVGVRRLWEDATDPITPRMYAWDGQVWQVWGEARPAGEPTVPPAPTGAAP
jgi:hypothetical protein